MKMCFCDGDDVVGFIPDIARVRKPKAVAKKRTAAATEGGVAPKQPRTAPKGPRAPYMCRACKVPRAGHKCPHSKSALPPTVGTAV